MPVSGNEESGVKPFSWKSSDYISGVPIKKRRFPIMRPPSPPPEEEPSLSPLKMNLVHQEQSSQSQGLTLSYASIATSSGNADTAKSPESDLRRGSSDAAVANLAKGNDNSARVKLEEPSIAHFGTSNDMRRKGMLVLPDNPAPQMTLGRELNLGSTEALASSLGNEISKHKVVMKCKEEIPAVVESTELSLGLKEHLFPALRGQKCDGGVSHLNRDMSEPVSLNLSLSEEKISSQSKGKDRDSNVLGAQMGACRANWDLNTPMDAWGDSVNAAPLSLNEINTEGGPYDPKLLKCATEMVEATVSSDKKTTDESRNKINVTMSSKTSSQQCKSNDSLLLRLSSSCSPSVLCQRPSSSIGLELDRVSSATNLPKLVRPARNLKFDNRRTVKPEPFDGRVKQEPSHLGPLDSIAGKHVSNMSTQILVDSRSVKSEPTTEVNQETRKSAIEGNLVQLGKQMMRSLDNRSCDMKLPVAAHMSSVAEKPFSLMELTGDPSCSTELTMSRDVRNHSVNFNGKPLQEVSQNNEKIAISLGHDSIANSMRTEDDNVDSQSVRLKLMNDKPLNSRGSGEGSASDEKVNISAGMLEDSYESDCESNGNHALDTEQKGKDDDYEDGEVRDLLENTAVQAEVIHKAREVEHADHDDLDNKRTEFVGSFINVHPPPSHVEAKDRETDNLAETSNNDHKEFFHSELYYKCNEGSDKDAFLQEPLAVEKVTSSTGLIGSINAVTTPPLDDQCGSKDSQKCQDAALFLNQVTIESQGTVVAVAQDKELNVTSAEPVLTSDSTLSKTSGSGDNATKDASNGGQPSRIITLPRSNDSPTRSRSISGRSFPSRAGREILQDVTVDDDGIPPRGRGETYADDIYRFSRERYQDQSWRNPRMNFRRGRGRMYSRGDWGSERYYSSEHHYNQTKYRVPRYKYVNDPEGEYSAYNMSSDSGFLGTGREGRKLSNDSPVNHRVFSRRRSPVGEQGIHMPRRYTRNISPSRSIDEDTSDLVGMRNNEKFVRGFPDDSFDPVFNRTQPSFDGDAQFGRGRGRGRGNRTFSFVQRRGIQVRSKSPIRSRTRSPGPWSSPRRGSPNYRMERFRSQDGGSFTGEMVARNDPSNELRDMNTVREHGHQRSVIHNRSPSGRILPRNRRFDAIDPREREDNTEFFPGGGSMNSGRLPELVGDGNGDERRRFGERRPVRTFRPPCNGADGETFQLNTEDGSRPFRFCQDGNETAFQERGSLREMDFDRRLKNRPGNEPRRVRSIEDEEGNFRHDGQPWKRKRF